MSVKQGLKAKQMHWKLNMRLSWEVFYDWKMEIRDWKRMQSHNYTSFPPQNYFSSICLTQWYQGLNLLLSKESGV